MFNFSRFTAPEKQRYRLSWFRQTIQWLVVGLLLVGPFFQLLRTLRQNPPPYPGSPLLRYGMRSLFETLDEPFRNFFRVFYDDITGGPFSIKFYFIQLVEPWTAFTHTLIHLFNFSVWDIYMVSSFALPLAIALIFGRVYCGYACPMSLIVSANLRLQRRYRRQFKPTYSGSPREAPDWSRYLFYSILLIAFAQPFLIPFITPPGLMQNGWSDMLLLGGFTLWTLLLLLLFVVEAIWPAYFCRRLCPTGQLLNRLATGRRFYLHHAPEIKCKTDCSDCIEACWLGLNPKGPIQDPACDMCGRCMQECPVDRIVIRKGTRKPISSILNILILLVLLPGFTDLTGQESYVNPASTHPLLESRIRLKSTTGESYMAYFTFHGTNEILTEGGMVAFHIHLSKKNQSYTGPLSIEVYENGERIHSETYSTVNFPISIPDPSVYRITFSFHPERKYTVKVSSSGFFQNSLTIPFESSPRF